MSTNHTHSGSAYTREEWEASARYAEEQAAEWREPVTVQQCPSCDGTGYYGFMASAPCPMCKGSGKAPSSATPPANDLAQHIFDALLTSNRALVEMIKKERA